MPPIHQRAARRCPDADVARQDHRRGVPLRRHLGGGRLHQPRHARRGGAHLHLRLGPRRHLDAHAVRLDGDAHRLCRHLADDGRHRHSLRPPRQSILLGDGRHGGRRAHLFHLADERVELDRARHARISRREGRSDRRARAGQGDLRRGAAPRRGSQSRQVALPRHHEPRAAHPAQCHSRLLRDHALGDSGAAQQPDLQGIRQRHPPERPAPAQPDQRDPRHQPHRGGPLRAA